MKQTIVRKGVYYDSVKLMLVTNELNLIDGVKEAAIVMGTDLNKESLERTGLLTVEANMAAATDMIIAIEGKNDDVVSSALAKLEELLKGNKDSGAEQAYRPRSMDLALTMQPQSNLCIISVPGQYAKDVAEEALNNNLNVMMFSDNMSLEDELLLKELAVKKDLLMMGPDCGTAMINGVPLCFCNKVRPGKIGIVAASGTGAQEVMTLVHSMGGGLSQVLGTGGRDLSEKIEGRMMLLSLKALNEDVNTEVIIVISKPPAKSVSEKILGFIRDNITKPVVVNFLGADFEKASEGNVNFEATLEGAAVRSVELAGYGVKKSRDEVDKLINSLAESEASKLSQGQKYVRGLYSGGTLAYESLFTMEKSFDLVYSNLSKTNKVKDVYNIQGHTTIDFGEDEFTNGRPHPMIDPTLRHEVFKNMLEDEETAVIVMDMVLGYGSNSTPHKVFVESLKEFNKKGLRYISIIVNICGTEDDPQDYYTIYNEMKEAGIIILDSNYSTVKLASRIITNVKGE
jgi:FdrA protein